MAGMAEAPRTDDEGWSRGTEEWEGDRLGRGQIASPTNQLAEIDIWTFRHTGTTNYRIGPHRTASDLCTYSVLYRVVGRLASHLFSVNIHVH